MAITVLSNDLAAYPLACGSPQAWIDQAEENLGV